jgi:hypothetical protein
MRTFKTGATRDDAENKIDYEGFLSPKVLERYGKYMLKHQIQSDGQLRASDNWQKGIDKEAYVKSLIRHTIQFWGVERGEEMRDDKGNLIDKQEALCAILFNAMGYLYEDLKEKILK